MKQEDLMGVGALRTALAFASSTDTTKIEDDIALYGAIAAQLESELKSILLAKLYDYVPTDGPREDVSGRVMSLSASLRGALIHKFQLEALLASIESANLYMKTFEKGVADEI